MNRRSWQAGVTRSHIELDAWDTRFWATVSGSDKLNAVSELAEMALLIKGNRGAQPRLERYLLEAFAAGGVKFLVVGGYAVGFHAKPRFTKVLDLLFR